MSSIKYNNEQHTNPSNTQSSGHNGGQAEIRLIVPVEFRLTWVASGQVRRPDDKDHFS